MNKEYKVYINQYGHVYYARTLKELRTKVSGRVSKMYIDSKGVTYHTGYVIGQEWLTRYKVDIKPV